MRSVFRTILRPLSQERALLANIIQVPVYIDQQSKRICSKILNLLLALITVAPFEHIDALLTACPPESDSLFSTSKPRLS